MSERTKQNKMIFYMDILNDSSLLDGINMIKNFCMVKPNWGKRHLGMNLV